MQHRTKLQKRIIDAVWDVFVAIRYPKLIMLLLLGATAFFLFRSETVQSFFHTLGELGYFSAFAGGMLFAFGFGAPFGVAILATIADDVNLLIGGLAGGVGALVTDMLIFKFVRFTFYDEIERLKRSKPYVFVNGRVFKRMPNKASYYLGIGTAGLMIASPLPDEFGVFMLAGLTKVSDRTFAALAFTLNTIGIFAVMIIGRTI